MAGPQKHRSRRSRTVTALLCLTALALLSLDSPIGGRDGGSPLDTVRVAVAAAFGPLEDVASGVTEPLRVRAADGDRATDGADDETDHVTVAPSSGADDRPDQLAALLDLIDAGQYETVPAQVVAVSPPQAAERTVTIDVGSIDGIAPQMTVVNGAGLVGRVIAVGPTSATVQLIIDAQAAVGARLERSSQLGIAAGGAGQLTLELLDPLEPVSAGDRVVSFGSGQPGSPYVAGVPIGTVTEVRGQLGSLDRVAAIEPYVDFTALDLVGVVLAAERTEPRAPIQPTRAGS